MTQFTTTELPPETIAQVQNHVPETAPVPEPSLDEKKQAELDKMSKEIPPEGMDQVEKAMEKMQKEHEKEVQNLMKDLDKKHQEELKQLEQNTKEQKKTMEDIIKQKDKELKDLQKQVKDAVLQENEIQ